MKNLHPKQNINLFKENRFCYQSGGEVAPKVAEQLDTSKKEKDPIDQLDARQATDLLKDPKKLDDFLRSIHLLDDKGDSPLSAVGPEVRTSFAIINLVAKIMTDQSALKEVADSILDPNKTLDDTGCRIMTAVIKDLNSAEDYAKRIIDNPKIEDRRLREAALLKITDVPYKVGKVKDALAVLSTQDYADKMAKKIGEIQVSLTKRLLLLRVGGRGMVGAEPLPSMPSSETGFADTVIRTIKIKTAEDGLALNELSNFIQDIKTPSKDVAVQQLIERQKTSLVARIFDQRQRQ